MKANNLVNSHNEWDELEEIIVGSARLARVPEKDKGMVAASVGGGYDYFDPDISEFFPEYILQETEEDIDNFTSELKKLNIKVRRPEDISINNFSTPDWHCDSFFPYCPRDVLLTVGNSIIETPNLFRSRYFETIAYKETLIEFMQSGARWISAPKPRLLDHGYNIQDKAQLSLNNHEPVFDAANVIRAGRDLFYLVSDSGNKLGMQWLQNAVGHDYTVHELSPNIYSSVHIDSTLSFLRPGLLLANPARVNEDNLPDILKKWEIIYAPKMTEYSYSDIKPSSSKWLGMNLLMLSPTLAVVDKHQTELIKLLEKRGIDVLPTLLRHGRTLGGGFHCITLDVRRKGKLESYF